MNSTRITERRKASGILPFNTAKSDIMFYLRKFLLPRYPARLLGKTKNERQYNSEGIRYGERKSLIQRIRNLFDEKWYIQNNLEVNFTAIKPIDHYVKFGNAQRQRPHPLFDTAWYLDRYDDVRESGQNALEHYILHGGREGRDPHPLFDATWYLDRNVDVRESNESALEHYILHGAREGRDPHPLFDVTWYLDHNTDVRESGQNPLEHYILHGAREGRDPHPLFDVIWYRQNNDGAFENPLIHYLSGGGRNPHPLFDEEYYYRQVKDIDFENIPLLQHFIVHGARVGYNPNAYFDCGWYIGNHETLNDTDENPLSHFVCAGLAEDCDPHPLFDLDWYIFQNPDVAQSGLNPLVHYLLHGKAEGRSLRPPDADDEDCSVLDIPYEIRRNPVITKDRDVCVLITNSYDGLIFPHIHLYLEALHANNIDVILTVVTNGLNRSLPTYTETIAGLVVRINHGCDFAAWATVLTAIPGVWTARSLILTNDSIFGPTDADRFRDLIQRVRASTADIVALTDSYQNQHHLMSYFMVYKRKALTSEHIHWFWNDVRSIRDKQTNSKQFELSLSQVLKVAELDIQVLFPTVRRGNRERNPTLEEWRRLIEEGFPFVNAQLLRDSDRLAYSNTAGWREQLAENPTLLEAIESYLDSQSTRHQNKTQLSRPIPGPRKRFQRSARLTTLNGSIQSTRPSERTDLCLEVPFRSPVDAVDLPTRVAVMLHVSDPNLCSEIRAVLHSIPVRTDLFISTDTNMKKAMIETRFSGLDGDITVKVFPSCGHNIAPMLVGYKQVFESYEIFLYIHSKHLLLTADAAPQRSVLITNLLGSRETVSSILLLLTKSNVGIVFSDHNKQTRKLLNWGKSLDQVRSMLRRIDVDISKDIVLDFPASSFFWGRSDAIRSLLALELGWTDFETKKDDVEGALELTIERAILLFAEASGFSWTKVGHADNVPSERLVPVWALEDVGRAHQRLLGNRLPPLTDRSLVPELVSVCTKPDRHAVRPRFNLVIPTLAPELKFGGITTALQIFREIASVLGTSCDLRIICQSLPINLRATIEFSDFCLVQIGTNDNFPKTIVDLSDQESGELGIHAKDVFLATAWWTASVAFSFQNRQKSYFGAAPRVLYLIQDHEPDFYGWSTQYNLAQQTYNHRKDMIALINSEELSNFMTTSYAFDEAYLVPFKINPQISKSLKSYPRERIICIYARPSTPRNAFTLLCAGIAQWQRNNPGTARMWRIVAVGETFPPNRAGSVVNLSVAGKLSLEDYADLLSRASVGISLMLSPHPSYPPLEMASSGIHTITNGFACKNLALRSTNIISIADLTIDGLAAALDKAVNRAEGQIGAILGMSDIKTLPSTLPDFDASIVVGRIWEMTAPSSQISRVE